MGKSIEVMIASPAERDELVKKHGYVTLSRNE